MPTALKRSSMNLNRLAYFAAVVDAGSFTHAATTLGITKAVVSQQVAKLEEEVGATLLLRTTRSVKATEAGRLLYARCTVILRESADAFDDLAQGAASPEGRLSIAAPLDYGSAVIVPVATELIRRYPRIEVVLNLSDRKTSPQENDLALRVGWLKASSDQARRIGSFEQWLVGAPEFSEASSRVRQPEDLSSCRSLRTRPCPILWSGRSRALRAGSARYACARRSSSTQRPPSTLPFSGVLGYRSCPTMSWPETSRPAGSAACAPIGSCAVAESISSFRRRDSVPPR